MKYLSAEFIGFKRFRARDIRRLRITFAEIIQLILGTNGSGKSSLLRELTPLPPNPSDYHKHGSKTIELEHRGSQYVMHSVFHPKAHHSIKKDGKELNEGGTRDVARKICWQEFGLTQEIHNLMLGLERFTAMGPAKRREWMMRLSGNDYDYALGVYNRLKDASNDIASTLRMTKKRLVTEQAKVMSDEEIKRLQGEVDQLYRELNVLMENRAPLDRPVVTYEQEQKLMMEKLQAMTNRLQRISFLAPTVHYPGGEVLRNEWHESYRPQFRSIAEVDDVISAIKSDIASTTALLNKEIAENGKYSEQADILSKTGNADLKELHERVKAMHNRKLDILSQRTLSNMPFDLDKIEPDLALSAWNSVADVMRDLFMTIPENRERVYSSDKLAELTKQLDEVVRKRTIWEKELVQTKNRIEHMESHRQESKVTCPKCSHAWNAGFSEDQMAALKRVVEDGTERLSALDVQIGILKENIQQNRDYGDKYRAIVRTMQAWPVLEPLWDYLQSDQYLTHKPRMALSVFDKLPYDLELMVRASKVDVEIRETSILIKAAEQLGDANLLEVKKKLEHSTHEIELLTAHRNRLQSYLREYEDYRTRLDEGITLGKKVEELYNNIVKCTEDMVEMMRRETILHCIRQLQTSLARKEETLSYVTLQRALVTDIEQQIVDLTVKDEAAKMVVRELSPTEGLIAEGLLGFIRHFVGEMNEFIRKIWTYSLVVQDCAVESDGGAELDYKFPMVVRGDEDDAIPDISDGSTSIKDVVDMAFVVCAMSHLGMADFPLFLDEPGASFDVQHRHTVADMIRSIAEQRRFSQLFMVSHYEDSYGAMANAEVLVLCESNVTVPHYTKFNQHVAFN